MARVSFHHALKWFRGRIGDLVYRRAHNGKVSVYPRPDMTRVRWSRKQKDHRHRFAEASKYATAAIADPEIRLIYVQMAVDNNKDPRRPSDVAFSDYYRNGNDLIWKKHMGDRKKPENWDIEDDSLYW